jgi:hypothetical protein
MHIPNTLKFSIASWEFILSRDIIVKHKPTNDQLVDLLTKVIQILVKIKTS